MIEWLYRSAWELSVLVTAIIIVNPVIRRVLNARVAYWLWLIPLITVILWDKPIRPRTITEITIGPLQQVTLTGITLSDVIRLSSAWPVLMAWMLGVVGYVFIFLLSQRKFKHFLRSRSYLIYLKEELLSTIPDHLKGRKINYFITSVPGAPFVTGLFKPSVYLPENFEGKFTLNQQKWIVTHELTHVRRCDLWSQLIAESIKACFWFNPVLYVGSRFFREDQELACDYQVLKNCDTEERVQYGEAMLQGMSANLLPATMAFFTLKKERFIMLQKHKKSKIKNLLGGVLCAGVAVFALTKAPSSIAVASNQSGDGKPQVENSTDNLSINLENIPLEKAVDLIVKFLKKDLIGESLLIDKQETITIKLDNAPAREALIFILSCNNFSYQEDEKDIKILEKKSNHSQSKECLQLFAS